MSWNWVGFGILILGWIVILWGLICFFRIVDDDDK
jgi:hypothetical protein